MKKNISQCFLKGFPCEHVLKAKDLQSAWCGNEMTSYPTLQIWKKKKTWSVYSKQAYIFLSKLYKVMWNLKDIWLRIIFTSWSRLLLDHVALSYSKSYINNIKGVLGINIYKKKLPYWDIPLLYSYFIEIVL